MPCLNLDRKQAAWRLTVLLVLLGLAPPLLAHSFGRAFSLPVPLWMYQYGAAGALVLSFMVLAVVLGRHQPRWHTRERDITGTLAVRLCCHPGFVGMLRLLSVLGLLGCILSGLLGHRNPYLNLSMTAFWVVFVLGCFYVQAILGDVFARLNPWRVVAEWVARVWPGYGTGRFRNPGRWGMLPALLLYMGFIWLELFGGSNPFHLGVILAAYTAWNLLACWLWGVAGWFRYGELFAVLFSLVARMAPLEARNGVVYLRFPLAGLVRDRCETATCLLVILFLLSSTAFDGLKATVPWLMMSRQFLQELLAGPVAADPAGAYALLQQAFLLMQGAMLFTSPFVYLAAYLLAIAVACRLTGGAGLRIWLLQFGHSLLPVAFVYHVTHYYTLLQVQGLKIFPLLSDPLGRGWNLLGTRDWFRAPVVPDPEFTWHVQVLLVLGGHIAGVYLAHLEAIRLAGPATPLRRIIAGQLPLLMLMVALTASGLWILAQPVAAGS